MIWIAFREYNAVFVFKTSRTCRHERSVLLPPLRSLRESNFCFSHVFLAITITMWIAFRESSHGVMPCIVVMLSVLPRERVHNAFYPRRATKSVSRSIRKRPCCQQSAGCSKELQKIREIHLPRKSTSVAYFFDNVYNRNVRDVDKYLHVTVSINIYCFCSGQIYAWICYADVGFRFIHTIMYNICRSAQVL